VATLDNQQLNPT